MNRMLPLRSRRSDRGAALLVAVILVAALAVIGLAVVNRASNEMQSVAAKRRYDSNVSCADAAQQLIRSQLQSGGLATMNITINNASLLTAHYDSVSLTGVTNAGGSTSASSSGGDMANRIGKASKSNSYMATVVCQNNNGQQQEVDVLFSFGL